MEELDGCPAFDDRFPKDHVYCTPLGLRLPAINLIIIFDIAYIVLSSTVAVNPRLCFEVVPKIETVKMINSFGVIIACGLQ